MVLKFLRQAGGQLEIESGERGPTVQAIVPLHAPRREAARR